MRKSDQHVELLKKCVLPTHGISFTQEELNLEKTGLELFFIFVKSLKVPHIYLRLRKYMFWSSSKM